MRRLFRLDHCSSWFWESKPFTEKAWTDFGELWWHFVMTWICDIFVIRCRISKGICYVTCTIYMYCYILHIWYFLIFSISMCCPSHPDWGSSVRARAESSSFVERNLQILSGGTVLEFRTDDKHWSIDKRWSTGYLADQPLILCWCDHGMGLVWLLPLYILLCNFSVFPYQNLTNQLALVLLSTFWFWCVLTSSFGDRLVTPLKATSRSPRSSPKKEPFKPSSPSPRLITKPLGRSSFKTKPF